MHFFKMISVAVFFLFLAACSSLPGSDLIRPGVPTGQLRIDNRSDRPMIAVAIAQCSATSGSSNRLPAGVTIPPGGSYTFTMSEGCYDVLPDFGGSTSYPASSGAGIYVRAGRTFVFGVG